MDENLILHAGWKFSHDELTKVLEDILPPDVLGDLKHQIRVATHYFKDGAVGFHRIDYDKIRNNQMWMKEFYEKNKNCTKDAYIKNVAYYEKTKKRSTYAM